MTEHIHVVVDTNILLHSAPLDQIPWTTLAGAEAVTIVLVTQVLRELDAKKNGESDKLKRRAQRVLASINKWLPPGTSEGSIAENIVLQVRPHEPSHVAGLDFAVGDDRIIAAAVELRGSGANVAIVTGDTAMRFKAEAHQLSVWSVPETYRASDRTPNPTAQPKGAKLIAGLALRPHDVLTSHREAKLGLSASHLVEEAQKAYRIAPWIKSIVTILNEPTKQDFKRYIKAIQQYDLDHAREFAMLIGVWNHGDAPADDVKVKFTFPAGTSLARCPPELPKDPRTKRNALRSLQTSPNARETPGDTLEIVDVLATVKARRVMQSEPVIFPVWVTVPSHVVGGFSIDSVVLSAAPPQTIELQLNVRFA